MKNVFNPDDTVANLFEAGEKSYLKREQSSANDKLMQHMMTKGTHQDKVTALAKQLQTPAPLKSLQSLVAMSDYEKNRKEAIMVISSLTEFFNTSLQKSQKYHHFSQSIAKAKAGKKKSFTADNLVEFYLDHKFKGLYQTFLKNLEHMLVSDLWFVKKTGINALCQLVRYEQMRSTVLSVLINKFGDKDPRTINFLTRELLTFSMHEFKCIESLLFEIQATIFRKNVSEECQFYCLNFLNNMNTKIMHETQLTVLFKLYFKIFTKCTLKQTDEDISSKLFLNTIKGLNKLFPVIKQEFSEFAKVFADKVDFIYKTIHTTTNTKVKIQLFLFLYQTLSYLNQSLSDRYYNNLYSFISENELLSSSLLQLFFDLLLISIKQDQNLPRIQAFVKRLLQLCYEAQPQFIITSLILISKIQDKIDTLLKKKEGYLVQEEETFEPYDMFKREPQYSKAENSCLWELVPFTSHYHPTVRKFADLILNSQPIQYNSNPLLDFSSSNFVEKICLKSERRSQGWKIKNHKLINKMRPSKYDTLINKPLQDLALDEEFLRKYLEKKSQSKRTKKSARDIQEYADEIVQKEINRIQGKQIDEDDDISYGSYDGDLEQEEDFGEDEGDFQQEQAKWDQDEGNDDFDEQMQEQDMDPDMFGDQQNIESMQEEDSPEQKGFNEMFEDINKDEDYYRARKKPNPKARRGQNRNDNRGKANKNRNSHNKKQNKSGHAPKTKKIKKSFKNKTY